MVWGQRPLRGLSLSCVHQAHGLDRLSYSTPKRRFYLVHRGRWFPLAQHGDMIAALESNSHGQAITDPQDIRQDTFTP
jgi:hypothetical protein